MINHARTLLLNRSGAQRPGTAYFLEEYVPEDFAPVTLPGALSKAYNVLIGNRADNAFANYRVWSLMRMLHATELASYVTALDPRVTYIHDKDVTRDYGTAYVASNVTSEGIAIYRVGTAVAERSGQRIFFRWLITVTDTDKVNIMDLESPGENTVTVTGDANITDPIALPNQTGMRIRIGEYPLTIGNKWELTTLVAPTEDMSTLVSKLEGSGSDVLTDVLGAGTAEPYATCRNIWNTSAFTVHQLSAFTLAYIYRVEAARSRG